MTIAGIRSSSWWAKATSAVGMVQKATTTCKNIAYSLIGRTLTYSAKENIAEYVGYYSGAAVGSAIVSKIAGTAMKQLGRVTGYGVAVAAGAIVTKTAYQAGQSNPSWMRTAIAAALGIAMMIILAYFSPSEMLGQAGEMFGTKAGSLIGGLAGAILGGFSAIFLHGSKENLWNKNDLLGSYTFKTIQCLIAFTLLDLWRSPSSSLFRSLFVDQAIGSLIYNAIDIGSFFKRLHEGKVLDEVLPATLSELIPEQISRDSLKDLLAKGASGLVISQAKLSTLISDQSQSSFIKELQLPLMEEIKKIIFDSSLIPLEAEFLHNQLKALIYPSAELVLKAQEPLTGAVKLGTNTLLNFSIQATNRYVQMIKQDGLIQQAQKEFDKAFSAWDNTSDPVAKKNLFQIFKQKKENLKATINTSLYQDAMGLYGLEAAQIAYQNLDGLKQKVSKVVPSSKEFSAKIIQELFKHVKTVLISDHYHLPPHIEKFAAHSLELIQRTEQEIIGISITPDNKKAYIGELLDIHLSSIAKLAVFYSIQLSIQPSDNQIREFYQNTITLIFDYYTSLLGTPVIGTVKDVLNNQIVQANLKK